MGKTDHRLSQSEILEATSEGNHRSSRSEKRLDFAHRRSWQSGLHRVGHNRRSEMRKKTKSKVIIDRKSNKQNQKQSSIGNQINKIKSNHRSEIK
jgi:hypothetical protein